MLEWLTRKKKRGELPEYSALRAVPTRALPSDLALEELGDSFTAARDAIERDLRESDRQHRDYTPLFTELIASDGRGVLSIPLPDDGGQCLPVFTTPYRAADYKQTLLTSGPPVQYVSSTAAQLMGMLCDVEKVGIKTLALDRCPRCSVFTVTGSSSLKADDLLVLWAIHKATELARINLYFTYALRSARAGQFETARDVALETVGHVSLEDPRPHLLLGEIGVALGDRTLCQEARGFLRFFKHDGGERKLADIVRAGQPKFEDLE